MWPIVDKSILSTEIILRRELAFLVSTKNNEKAESQGFTDRFCIFAILKNLSPEYSRILVIKLRNLGDIHFYETNRN
jgi:hypothetical protein